MATPCILAWRIPWTREPGGSSPQGRKELDTTELMGHTHTHIKIQRGKLRHRAPPLNGLGLHVLEECGPPGKLGSQPDRSERWPSTTSLTVAKKSALPLASEKKSSEAYLRPVLIVPSKKNDLFCIKEKEMQILLLRNEMIHLTC